VIDGRTGDPVAGATVRCGRAGGFRQMDLTPHEFAEYSRLHSDDREELLRRNGDRLITGADGTFVLDGLQGFRGWVTARKGDLYGRLLGERDNTIVVEPDRVLTVEVFDAAGAPVSGVDVGPRPVSWRSTCGRRTRR
jgi:hypothetical protein